MKLEPEWGQRERLCVCAHMRVMGSPIIGFSEPLAPASSMLGPQVRATMSALNPQYASTLSVCVLVSSSIKQEGKGASLSDVTLKQN